MMNISVCMATFNGENYLSEQLDSIINQLSIGDELIIVDDSSTDSTMVILKGFCDPRISIYENKKNMGVNATFEKAILLAKNEIIFLADQDDIWLEGRVSLMVNHLCETSKMVVSTNFGLIDACGDVDVTTKCDRLNADDSGRHLSNIIGIILNTRPYYGCAMAINKAFIDVVLPMPKFIESHDLWIAMASNLARSNSHLSENTLMHRIHGNNASVVRRSLYLKLRSRLIFVRSLIVIMFRLINFKVQKVNSAHST